MARYTASQSAPDLKTFVQDLETRLNACSHDELKSLLTRHARGLVPGERESFLSIFSTATGSVSHKRSNSDCDEELLADIEAFVNALEDGDYFEDWGWDDSIHDERAYGDMSWVDEMDDLFERASEMYLAGYRELSKQAYGELLHAFGLDEETGHFCGAGTPDSLVATDVIEAKARYLRCVYETSTLPNRANAMLSETGDLRHLGGEMHLQAVINADTAPLPDKEVFLQEWIDALKKRDSSGTEGFPNRWWRPLLREAVALQDPVNGLAQLAKESGDVHPEAYHDWVVSLWQSDAADSAIAAAREGLERIVIASQKARLADALAAMTDRVGEVELALSARWQAWRASPTLRRLLAYVTNGVPDRAALDARLAEELLAASEGSYVISGPVPSPGGVTRLRLLLHLLAHDYETMTGQVANMKPVGWHSSEHPGPVVFPFLVLAASGLTDEPDEGSSLAHLLGQMPDMMNNRSYDDLIPLAAAKEPAELMLAELILDTLACHPVTPEDRQRYLNMAIEVARKRIDSIVSNKHRGAYERAARLAVAIGEAMSMAAAPANGADFAISFRAAYPRHIAFRDELERLMSQSPYLPSPPRRSR